MEKTAYIIDLNFFFSNKTNYMTAENEKKEEKIQLMYLRYINSYG